MEIRTAELGLRAELVGALARGQQHVQFALRRRRAHLRGQVERVRRVVVSDQGRPGVSLIQGTLRIVIDADAGIAGRPSSARIVRVVGGDALNR